VSDADVDSEDGSVTFKQASETVVPFGKHSGETIDQIASGDRGLLYLDWLNGWMADVNHSNFQLRQAVAVYLEDEGIRRDLAEASEKDREILGDDD
jgi:hypothetical protein